MTVKAVITLVQYSSECERGSGCCWQWYWWSS